MRQFHYERQVVILHEFAQDDGGEDGQYDSQQVDAEQNQCGVVREESSCEENEYRQSSGA